jgi:hypothetical protein
MRLLLFCVVAWLILAVAALASNGGGHGSGHKSGPGYVSPR